MKHRAYLSGPMSGHPDYNFAAFHEAAAQLRDCGMEVFNPAESFDGNTTLPWSTYMRTDISEILNCTQVRVLPGWENSVGARLEVAVALALGLPVARLDGTPSFEYQDKRDAVAALLGLAIEEKGSILEEAQRLVHGHRGDDYGHPADDFAKTAKIWTGILMPKLLPGVEISVDDVPMCMIGVKLSREVNKPKRDNRVDGAGYFETLDMVRTRMEN